jgi:CcmD family protein
MIDRRNFEFLFYGFTVAWLIVFIYLIALIRRGARIRAQLTRCEKMIGDRTP